MHRVTRRAFAYCGIGYLKWDNQSKGCICPKFTLQKINYLHNDPIAAEIIEKPEDYGFISAKDYALGIFWGLIKVNMLLNNLMNHESSS
jgi:hypothetical protein